MMIRQTRVASLAAIALVSCFASSALADPAYQSGNGIISFGVTDYGAPVPGVPTFINNNFTGLNDILASPGGTFLTANPVLANNIASYAYPALPGTAFQVGGGNVNGSFGTGDVVITGPGVYFDGTDPVPGGGSASYEIASWNADYTDAAGSAGNFGNYLSIGGVLPAVGSAAAVSLVTEVTSLNPASPFFGGIDLPALILADAQVSPGVYSWVALGGSGAAILTNGIDSSFVGLAVNSIPVVIPAGDAFTVTTTLTAYADPASIDSILPDMSLFPELQLPGIVVGSSVPEPSSFVLAAIAAIGMFGAAKLRRRKR